MKNVILVLSTFLLFICGLNAQSKKDLEVKVSALQSQLDSLTMANAKLSQDQRSAQRELDRYETMYLTAREKLGVQDFAPEDIGILLDSVQLEHEKTLSEIEENIFDLRASVNQLEEANELLESHAADDEAEIERLNERIERLSKPNPAVITDEQVDALKKLKDLMDSGILTQEEFDSRKSRILHGS